MIKLTRNIILLFLFLVLADINLIKSKEQNLECINPNGHVVDWYVILLFPRSSEKSGILSYGYYDNTSTALKYYSYDKESFPPLDFTNLNSLSEITNYIFWNDDRSTEGKIDKAAESKGHSKGGLIYNKTSGKYIMHSLPRFPRRTDENEVIKDLPDNAGIYGQHFLCISLHTNEILKLLDHLIIINPSIVYSHGDKDRVGLKTQVIEQLLSGKADRSRASSGSIKLKSNLGREFDIFTKGNGSPDLPYDSIIPNEYGSSIFVETWSKPEMLDIICDTKYKVKNVLSLKFGKYEYTRDNEHSKWAVLDKKSVSCYSDLNRIASQKRRGGMAICINDENLANIMRAGIKDYEECKSIKSKKNLTFLEIVDN